MIIHNVEQGTEEWYALRRGKMTASKAQAIASAGKGLDTLCLELVSEILTNGSDESYTNPHMERGNELEEKARQAYAIIEGYDMVDRVGFVELDKYIGCSPDGFIYEDGLVEIKCPSNKVYTELLINKKPPSQYIWQCQMQMLVTDRAWCDLVFFNPNFEKSMQIYKQIPNDDAYEKINNGLNLGKEKIQEWLKAAS